VRRRCAWVTDDDKYIAYHDEEWGVPRYDDDYLFEMLSLEGAQAGLSWLTILKRREGYREVFAHFSIEEVAMFSDEHIEIILRDERIIRNRRKVASVVHNARVIERMRRGGISFSQYIWDFVDGEPIVNEWNDASEVPASTELSTQMSKRLKKDGFTFVGPVICYSFMQAVGMINDHTNDCFLANNR